MSEIRQVKNMSLYPDFPKKNLLIEVTNNCNCKCIFCANSKMKRKKDFINPKLILKILNEAYELGTREVGFYTTGESLLDKNLSTYIKLAKKIGYLYIYITTNAILLDEHKTKELVNAGIDSIKLSINAINSYDYKFIHGVDAFEIVMKNLENLYEYRKKNNLKYKIFISYIATKFTNYNTEKIKEKFNKFSDEIVVVNVRNQSGMMPEINKYLKCGIENDVNTIERTIPCHYVFDTINITCEGYLTACCTDFENYLTYADLNETSLKDAWQNSTITKLRKKHLNNKIKGTLCYNCVYSSKKIPFPLNKKYYTIITKEIFDESNINDRLKKYDKIRKY